MQSANGIGYLPAALDIEEMSPTIEFGFDGDDVMIDGSPLEGEWQQLWIAARLPRVFHFTPSAAAHTGDRLLNFAFLAVELGRAMKRVSAYPFACVKRFDPDDVLYEQPQLGLVFSTRGPSKRLRRKIAGGFWSLLKSAPSDLQPFLEFSYGPDGEFRLVGLDRQGFFCEAAWDELEPDLYWPHTSYLPGERFRCPDCDGTGIEDRFPYLEDCATCGGTGAITW
jgi:hypothetical protein